MTEPVSEAPTPAKADPETLVLRGTPSRVVKFRRGAIIAIAALGSTAMVGAAWVALKPATFRMVSGGDDRTDVSVKAPADALASAPKSYGDVPQLGARYPAISASPSSIASARWVWRRLLPAPIRRHRRPRPSASASPRSASRRASPA
ncbi:hypothetical protein [Hankyongella ginsenosidimutans]|uniref:hypothetical protein n=1 Tax=Hankyongella ginsenosidimutans TaxID=1763828 RepID=UPI00319E95F0